MSPFRRPVTPDQLARYRTPSLMAVVLAHFLPPSFGRYEWYRRAKGGRWTTLCTRKDPKHDWNLRWLRAPSCPGKAENESLFSDDFNKKWGCRINAAQDPPKPCACEVWGKEYP